MRTSLPFAALCLALGISPAFGQATTTDAAPANAPVAPPPSAPAGSAAAEEQSIVLDPFVVDASQDTTGYKANSTLAGTRVRTNLADVASSITVVTAKELQDLAALNNEDLLVYTPSTEVGGIRGNFSGMAASAIYSEQLVNPSTRVRGLDSADNTRDYFLTDIPWDSFNVGRIDLQRGPNSILFGIGSPAGIINTSPNDASWKSSYNLQNRTDRWGSLRESVDINQVIIPDVLAIRLSGVIDREKFEQDPAYNNSNRYYAALKFQPKLFDEHNQTTIRVKFEDGRVNSNNPRSSPPVDEITPWFKTGTDAYGNPGYNKLTVNEFSLTNKNPSGIPLPGGTNSVLTQATYELGGWAETRSYWPDIINYYEGTPTQRQNPVTVPPSDTPIKTITAEANTGYSLNSFLPSNPSTSIGGTGSFRPLGIPSEFQYASYVGPVSGTIYAPDGVTKVPVTYPGGAIPGGVYYADTVLTDPSIFNFYKRLLDGPNKHEWQNWRAVNFALDQTFLDGRFAFELAVDHQDYSSGQNQFMTGSNYAISVDVNQTYADGTPNPNVGRPYVGNATSNVNNAFTTKRDTIRFTPNVEIRPEDFIQNRRVAEIIGKQNLTGIAERTQDVQNNVSWAQYATTTSYITDNYHGYNGGLTPNIGTIGSNREFSWIDYIGPSLANASSAHGADLQNINFVVAPPHNEQVRNFNSHWNASTAPGTPGYVDPTAPYTYYSNVSGQLNNGSQRDNPANYVGWSYEPVTWESANNPSEFPDLVQSAGRTRYRDDSEGFVYQGYLLGGDLVPAFGWRKDRVTNFQTNAITDQTNGFTSLNFPDDQTSRTDVQGESKSWGVVYHLPRAWFQNIPWEPGISLSYNNSENFKADAARLDLAGNHIPNAKGKTKEVGVTFTALHDKVSLKVVYFKTKVTGATLADTEGNSIGGLGNNGYFLADGMIWGYGWATALQDGLTGHSPGDNFYDAASNDGFGNRANLTPAQQAAYDAYNTVGGTSPTGIKYVGGNAIVNAWLGLAGKLSPNYFGSFNLAPSLNPNIAAKTGFLRDAYNPPIDDSSGPYNGGGSQFGNHQVTVDNLSQGVELEFYAQPIKNWDITLNYSHVKATHQNIDTAAQNFIGMVTAFMNGPGGQLREWYNGGGPIGNQWNSSIVAPFTVELNELGHAAPEVSPWRLNLVNTYNFDMKPLRGLFVGGGLRIDAGRIIGYHFDPNFKNVNSSDPNYAAVTFLTQGGLNVNQPFIGQNETHVDGWVGYNWKVSHRINWRIQLNLQNIGEKDRLIAARINPDGNVALARIQEGMGWTLTNSFDF